MKSISFRAVQASAAAAVILGILVPSIALANKNVSIDFAGTGSGTVVNTQPTPTGGKFNCTSTAGTESGTCDSVAFGNNDQITLSATPATGSIIGGWNVGTYTINSGCGSSDLTCQFTMNNTAQTIIITFVPTTATLTVIKTVVNDNGGTATAADWSLAVTSSNGGGGTGSAAGSESGTVYTLDAGKDYSVAESGGPVGDGYTESDSSDCSIVNATAGGSYTCTITNDDIAPSLTLNKILVTDNGSPDSESDWTLTADGGAAGTLTGSGAEDSTDVESNSSFKAGTYVLSEEGPTGYSTTGWSCTNDISVTGDNQITLGLGQNTTCTITNDDIAPHLTLVKSVDSTGDSAETPPTADRWTLSASGPTPLTGASGGASGTGVTDMAVDAGSYTLDESGDVAHYAPSTGWVCSGVSDQDGTVITLAPGNNATCTITNAYVPPGTITIVKEAVGGDATFSFTGDLGAFDLATNGGGDSETFSNLEPGTFAVVEGELSGWRATSATCDNGDDPSAISLSSDETVICIFTNTKDGKIIVDKVTDPSGEEQSFDFSTNYSEDFSLSDASSPNDSGYLEPGSYSVSESTVPSGWAKGSATCDNGDDPSDITLVAGETVTCTFVNNKLAVLTIVKETDSSAGSFDFTVTNTDTEESQSVNLYNDEGADLSEDVRLAAGTYDVTEDAQSGWRLANVSCSYDGDSVGQSIAGGEQITVEYGDAVTCTFTNTQRAVLVVKKVVVNDDSGVAEAADFTFQVSKNGEPFESPIAFEADGENHVIVDGGEGNIYAVTEEAADGYTTTYDACGDVTVDNLDRKTCTITNDDIAQTPAEETTTPPPPTGGGNGPIVGSFGVVLGASTGPVSGGQVLGASTSTCDALITQIPMGQRLPNNSAQVKALQGFLNGEVGAGLPTTGFFGPLTNAAVKTFQLKYWQEVLAPWVPLGLPTDHTATGWVGKTTAWKVNMLYCPTLNLSFPALP